MLPPPGSAVGVLLPNSAGVAVTFFALQTIARVPAMFELLSRHGERTLGMQSRKRVGRADLAGLRRKGTFRSPRPIDRRRCKGDLPGRRASDDHLRRQAQRSPARRPPAGRGRLQRARRDPLHLGLGGHPERRRPLAPEFARQLRPEPDRASPATAATRSSTRFPSSILSVSRPAC